MTGGQADVRPHFVDDISPPDVALIVRLCDGERLEAGALDQWEDAALDAGFELVLLDGGDVDEAGPTTQAKSGSKTMDSSGIERIRAALQAHPWPPLRPEPPTDNTSGFDDDFAPFQSAPKTAQADLGGLFGHMQALRAEAETIDDPAERRRFAERVALAFAAHLDDDDDDAPDYPAAAAVT